jgi:hypothetical protein
MAMAVAALGLPGVASSAADATSTAGGTTGRRSVAAADRAAVDELGGVSGIVLAESETENLCVVARSAGGTSPAVKSRTFQVPGVDQAVFSIGSQPGRGIPAGTWQLRAGPCDGSGTNPPTPRFHLDDVRVDGGVVTAGLVLVPDEESASIEGDVVDAARDPVEGACVSAVGMTDGTTAGAATSGAAGRYEISGLPPGDYHVVATGCSNGSLDLRGAATDEDGKPRSVEATADGAEGVTVTLGEGRRVEGKLVDDQGGALSGSCVQAGDRRTVTGDSGAFDLRGVADDVASITVSTCGDGQGVVDEQIGISGDDRTVDLGDVEVERGGTVEGTVVDGDGLAVPGLLVTARRKVDGPDVVTAVTDGAGGYRMTGIRPGTYVLIINPDGSRGLPTAWSTADDIAGAAESAEGRAVDSDAPVRFSAALGDATSGSDVVISVTPVEDASITVDGIRRADRAVTVPLSPGEHLVEFGDVTGWTTPGNQAINVSDDGTGEKQEVTGTYAGPLVRLTAEVPETALPVTVNGRPAGSGRVTVAVPPDEDVRVCSGDDSCLPAARAADLVGEVLRPPAVEAGGSPSLRAIPLGSMSTVLDAQVSLDGELRVIGQALLPADAGRHDVQFGDVPGYLTPLPHRLALGATGEVPVVARYLPLAPATIDPGTEDGTVWVDGSPIGSGPVSIGLRPGTRRVCAEVEDEVRCTDVEAHSDRSVELTPGRFTS